jgi:carbamoyltransferase
MRVLGISGRYRHAAAALAVDGHVTAAASEDCFVRVPGIGYMQTGGFPGAAVEACLRSAGLMLADIDRVTVVDDEGNGPGEMASMRRVLHDRPMQAIDAVHADAVQAAVSGENVDTVLVCSTHPPAIATFVREREHLVPQGRIAGGDRLMSVARALATNLGVATDDPYRSLDRLSVGGEPEFQNELSSAIKWSAGPSAPANGGGRAIEIDEDRWSAFLGTDRGSPVGSLADARSLNVRTRQVRRALAASFTCRLAHLVYDAVESLRAKSDRSVALGGEMCANPRFNTELRGLLGDQWVRAFVPETAGRALGAALEVASGRASTPLRAVEQLPGLALGPAFSDNDIKRTLENCRLDYLYEPDWSRLLMRVSKMLSQGKVVAWFQGAMAFGPRALGSRSVLCDPSSRYARQNMNEYLRQVPLDEPLPIVFAPSAAQQCLNRSVSSPLGVVDVAVKDEWRDRLVAALDWRQHVRVQAVGPAQAPELCNLTEHHYTRTGVPGLIETNLGGPVEPMACTPRDAVRTVFSSAIDALVIGRFLLMKDYWLLRSNGA